MTTPHDEKRLQRYRAKASRLDEEIRQLEQEIHDDQACVCGEINTRHCPVHAGGSNQESRSE